MCSFLYILLLTIHGVFAIRASIKRNPTPMQSQVNNYFASTVTGMESVLAKELAGESIGASSISTGKAGVFFQGFNYKEFIKAVSLV